MKDAPSVRFPSLRRNVACDVAIVGTGITGALVAHQLVGAGLDVVVLDRRPASTGSTSASTGLLLYETDTPLAELERRHGARRAARAYALGRRAIRDLGEIITTLGIDCDYAPRHTLYLASDRAGVRVIRAEHAARRRAGFDVERLTGRELGHRFGLEFPGALYSGGSAQVNAYRLSQGLLATHAGAGRLRVFQQTRVTRADPDPRRVRLATARGHAVTARCVVFATGYEAAPYLPADLVELNSTYVIASRPMPRRPAWTDTCMLWETARPYIYARTVENGRMMIGGEDEPFADPVRRDALMAAKARKLEKRFDRLFPGLPFEREFTWCGTFAGSRDGLPYIGAMNASPRMFYALGYGGNGITFSQIAATLLRDMCLGKRNRDTALFRLDRDS